MTKKIICGEIREDFMDTPINIFKKAVELSKIDSFTVKTNNPQLVEALEVLCGEKKILFLLSEVVVKIINRIRLRLCMSILEMCMILSIH